MLNRQRQCLRFFVGGDVAPSAAPMAENQRRQEKLFPKGLRVLVVDDDTVSLAVLERMLLQCDYNVTACTSVSQAISLVMENSDRFDIVMSDVYLPSADGFKLLEAVGIGFGLPVIMMSANSETDVVMRSITCGACNHLLKPIRIEEVQTIWQHVLRSHGQQSHCHKPEKSHGGRVWCQSTVSKKRKHGGGQVVQYMNSLKTGRVHWTDQLHWKFVKAVNQTGVDHAAPKKILEIMNIEGLTRENVASHLQKYRLYLNRLRGSIPEPRPVASFQAATDGKSGGTMQILQRGKTKSENAETKPEPNTNTQKLAHLIAKEGFIHRGEVFGVGDCGSNS